MVASFSIGHTGHDRLWKQKEIVQLATMLSTGTSKCDSSEKAEQKWAHKARKTLQRSGYLGPLPIPHNSSPPHPAPRSKVCLATAAKNEWGF